MAPDYREVLAELRTEEARLLSELEAIRAMIPGAEVMARRMPSSMSLFTAPAQSAPASRPYEGMGPRQGIICLLVDTLRPLMPVDITRLLQEGGVGSRSADFAATISSTLTQLRAEGIVERREEGWVIAMRPDPMGNPPMNVAATDPVWVKISNALGRPL